MNLKSRLSALCAVLALSACGGGEGSGDGAAGGQLTGGVADAAVGGGEGSGGGAAGGQLAGGAGGQGGGVGGGVGGGGGQAGGAGGAGGDVGGQGGDVGGQGGDVGGQGGDVGGQGGAGGDVGGSGGQGGAGGDVGGAGGQGGAGGAVEPGAVDVRIEGTFSVGPVAPPVPENVPAGDGDGCGFLGATDFRATVEDASGVALRYMPAEGSCAAGRYVLEVAVPGGRDRAVLRVTLDLVERDPATGAERIIERVVQTVEVDLSAGAPVVQVQVVATGGERCGPDGVDDDADGLTDCDDAECFEVCRDEDCGNGVEDDNDRLIDCADPECAGQPACRGVEVCDQQGDEDGDGVDGCRDPDCARHPFCAARVERLCGDQLDDDGDFLVDCADPDCAGQCGSVDISWQLRRNGQVIDCADVEGNTVFFGFAGPNAEIIRPTTADCNTTPTRVQLLAGQYTLGLRLESIGGVELSVAAPIDVPVVAGNHLPLPTFILDIAAPDACGTPVVIDSIYPSGAIDDGMAWERDFVVLHNRRPAPYDLAGHGLLFIPPGGDPRRIDLSGVIPASSAYLIAIGPRQFVDANLPALGYLGFPLPEPDLAIQVEQQIDLFAQAAYVLVSSPGVPPAGSSCPFPGQLDAFAPAGNACSEGFGFFGGPGTDSAITRVDACVDTDVNGQDFAMQVIDAEHPIRNSASPARACACP